MKKKYVYKPYSVLFPKIFANERNRLLEVLEAPITIEHIGSTAVPGLGGKGIMDICIVVPQKDLKTTYQQIESLGYIYRESGSTAERLFFRVDLPDSEEGVRRYHVHLTFPESKEYEKLIAFRDYLRNNPKAMQEYADLKKKSAEEVNEDGALYRKLKAPFFENILNKVCDDRIDIFLSTVQKLVFDQFPEFKELPIKLVEPNGWDNRTFRLGDAMSVRLPSAERYAAKVEIEHKWLPFLANNLNVSIPQPIAMGKPSQEYPWRWSIYRWIEGKSANIISMDDYAKENLAKELALFLRNLHSIDPSGAPKPGEHNFFRGDSPVVYDEETRRAIDALKDYVDEDVCIRLWEKSISTNWSKDPVWIHGDFSSGNFLIKDDKLAGVIDFGGMAAGDPACDLVIAWTFLNGKNRDTFKSHLNLDQDTWDRARGWALWKALITLEAIEDKSCARAQEQFSIIDAVLSEPND